MNENPDLQHARSNAESALSLLDRTLEQIVGRGLNTRGNTQAESHDRLRYQFILVFFATLAYRTLKSICILCDAGLSQNAIIHLRLLCEVCINALYISEDPLPRTPLYLEYYIIARKDISDKIQECTDEDLRSSMGHLILKKDDPRLANYKSIKLRYPKRRSWSGKTIRDMADDVGLTHEYNFSYSLQSNFMHANAASINAFVKSFPGGSIFNLADSPQLSVRPLKQGTVHALRVLKLLDDELGLNLDEDIASLVSNMRRQSSN